MNATELSPHDIVVSKWKFPFPNGFRQDQKDTINKLAPIPRSGLYLDVGLGKTSVATAMSLYKMYHQGAQVALCLMPPILINGWDRWLRSIPGVTTTVYRGTPKQRKEIKLDGMFILMSLPIFKRDYDHLFSVFTNRERIVLVDEATSCKNFESENFKMVRDFAAGQHLMLLTGTPLSTPNDGYGMIRLVAPGVYRNYQQFCNIHVAERNFFKNIKSWKNLDLLADNLKVNSVRILRQDVLKDLPNCTITPLYYELDAKHYRLYKELAEEQLLPLNDGGKIDATQEMALHHALQQIVVNWDYFADDPSCISAAIELVEEVMEELAGRKLVIFAQYRRTNAKLLTLLAKYNAVGAYGAISAAQQSRNLDRFISDPACLVFVGQPGSLGYGVNGLQHVCHDMLFLEMPQVPRDFHQAVARLWRDGQTHKVHVRVAVAERTLQVRKMDQLLAKDALVGKVQRNFQDLRAAIFGE